MAPDCYTPDQKISAALIIGRRVNLSFTGIINDKPDRLRVGNAKANLVAIMSNRMNHLADSPHPLVQFGDGQSSKENRVLLILLNEMMHLARSDHNLLTS